MEHRAGIWKTLIYLKSKIEVTMWIRIYKNHVLYTIPDMDVYNFQTDYILSDTTIIFCVFNNSCWGKMCIRYKKNLIGIYVYEKKVQKLKFIEDRMPEQWLDKIKDGKKYNEEVLIKKICVSNFSTELTTDINIRYPSMFNSDLKDIRNILNFDLEKKTELQTILFIMRWVNRFFKPGPIGDIDKKNKAIDFIMDRKQKMNCMTYSLVLNDILNAFGLKCRMLHCLSYDIYDLESHFINEVYWSEQKKWILLDGAFGNIICDVNFFPLNTVEIRDNIRTKKKMYICAGERVLKNVDTKNYWYGIIKNFFRFKLYKEYYPGFYKRNFSFGITPDKYNYELEETHNIIQLYNEKSRRQT